MKIQAECNCKRTVYRDDQPRLEDTAGYYIQCSCGSTHYFPGLEMIDCTSLREAKRVLDRPDVLRFI